MQALLHQTSSYCTTERLYPRPLALRNIYLYMCTIPKYPLDNFQDQWYHFPQFYLLSLEAYR